MTVADIGMLGHLDEEQLNLEVTCYLSKHIN
jgi:hypothetical protein